MKTYEISEEKLRECLAVALYLVHGDFERWSSSGAVAALLTDGDFMPPTREEMLDILAEKPWLLIFAQTSLVKNSRLMDEAITAYELTKEMSCDD